jgi:CRISPR-associated protein Cas2
MIYVILYDITHDKTRTRVSRILEQHGYERIQFSTFVGNQPPQNIKGLWKTLNKLLSSVDCESDKILVIRLPAENFKKMMIIGKFTADMEYLLGRKTTMLV